MNFFSHLRAARMARSAVVCLTLVVAGLACGDSGSPIVSEPDAPAGDFRVAQLEISGMTCHGCAAGVQDTLKALPGVTDAVVSREEGVARVTLHGDSATGEKELRAAVDAKGYKVIGCRWDS